MAMTLGNQKQQDATSVDGDVRSPPKPPTARSMPLPDYYATLGIEATASVDDIRHAYQRLALLCHPDNHISTSTALIDPHARFMELADAYFVLSNGERRKAYDEARKKHGTMAIHKVKDAQDVFADAFEELMKPELEKHGWVWGVAGGISGGTLGFIIMNVPGALVGAAIGSTLGKIRDRKGKSVAEVFSGLTDDQRSKVIAALVKKVIGTSY